jgi:hypothetical protein
VFGCCVVRFPVCLCFLRGYPCAPVWFTISSRCFSIFYVPSCDFPSAATRSPPRWHVFKPPSVPLMFSRIPRALLCFPRRFISCACVWLCVPFLEPSVVLHEFLLFTTHYTFLRVLCVQLRKNRAKLAFQCYQTRVCFVDFERTRQLVASQTPLSLDATYLWGSRQSTAMRGSTRGTKPGNVKPRQKSQHDRGNRSQGSEKHAPSYIPECRL